MLPFARKAAAPREKAVVKDSTARWGIILVGVGFALVYSIRDPNAQDWRIAVAVPLGLLSVVTSWLAVRHLDKQWRFDAALSEHHELVRSGPYAVVRHPIYAAMLAMLLSAGFLLTRWPALIAAVFFFVLGTEIRIRSEEKLLRARFGEEFAMYQRSVSAYLPLVR